MAVTTPEKARLLKARIELTKLLDLLTDFHKGLTWESPSWDEVMEMRNSLIGKLDVLDAEIHKD